MSNNKLKYIVLGGLFLIPFVPLVIANSLFFPFIVGKALVFRLIVEIIFGVWFILCLRDETYRPKFSWLFVSILAFLAVVGIADILSVNPFKSFWSNYERMEGFIGIAHFVMFFVVCGSILRESKVWNYLLTTSFGVSFLMSIYSLLQIMGKITINQGGVRVDGTFGNASYLAIYMVFHIFIGLLLFLRSERLWQKSIFAIVSILNMVILYYTATRGAILGFIGGLIITFAILALGSEKGSRLKKISLYFILSISVLVGLFALFRNNSFLSNNPVLSRFSSLSLSEIKNQGRYYVWPMAYKGFLEKPFFGWGQESFNYVFNKYYDPRMYKHEAWFDRTHNTILDWTISAGGIGAISYLTVFVLLLVSVWKARVEDLSKRDKAIITGLLSAYFFNNLFVFDQIGSYILFFTVLAYIHSLSTKESPGFISRTFLKIKTIFGGGNRKCVFEALIILIVLALIYFVVYLPWKANKNLLSILSINSQGKILSMKEYSSPFSNYSIGFSESLEHISQFSIGLSDNPNVPTELKQNLFTLMNGAFEKQIKISPNDARYRLFYGLFLSRYGNYEKALEQLNTASSLSPNKQSIYFEIASNLLLANKPKEALAIAKKSYELEPNFEEARFVYGLIALVTGDARLASEMLSAVSEAKLVFDDRFLNVLVQIGDMQKVFDVIRLRINTEPNNIRHRLTLVAAYLGQNRRQEAINSINDAIKIDPSFKETGDFYIKEIQAGRNP